MHGLPNQTLEQALSDLKQAIELEPYHISWYQLTIEPNTLFHSKPPKLPEDETLWEIQAQGHELLKAAGYEQYEISAYAKRTDNSPKQHQCRHNLNYWKFGDYLGIGCGAHGKITDIASGRIIRTEKVKHPKGYMDMTKPYRYKEWQVEADDLPFEYFMNRLRLKQPFTLEDFEQRTGLNKSTVIDAIEKGVSLGLLTAPEQNTGTDNTMVSNNTGMAGIDKEGLERVNAQYQITTQGLRYYNNLVDLFL